MYNFDYVYLVAVTGLVNCSAVCKDECVGLLLPYFWARLPYTL